MADLIAQSATGTRLPLDIGQAVLEDAQPEAITWVAPFDHQTAHVAQSLGGFPEPNETREIAAGQAVWIGPGQALILGAPVAPEIIPGRPPINAVISPTRNAAYNPTSG